MSNTNNDSKAVRNEHLEERGTSPKEETSLSHNLEARIRNPLQGIPRSQLMADVENFALRRGLQEHVAILKKGALVAQDPGNIRNIDGPEKLASDEIEVLEEEVTHKWRMPMKLFLTIFTCSIGAAVQGWDQTGSNGATIFFPAAYGIGSKSDLDHILVGLINAGPYIGASLIGCWLADPLNNRLGRRGTIFFAAQFCIWPVIGSAFCRTWQQQLACRLLMGIGMGSKASTVPVYAAENAPASIRGALVMSWQMWTAFGIMLGTAVNLAVYQIAQPLNWRLMLGAPFLPAVPLMALIFFCPESPRWYIKKGRFQDAWRSMAVLRRNEIQVARDIYYISAQLELEREVMGTTNYATRFGQLFTVPRVRRANLAAFTVMIAQQMCGINIIAFYSTSIFEQAFKTDPSPQFKAMIGSFGFGVVNWLFAFPAFFTIDTFGRRSLLLFTFPQMFWTLLAAGLCTLIDPNGSMANARTGLVCLFVFLFGAFYSPGEGPVPYTYSAEVYPLSHRETGMSFAVATCLFFAAVLGITFPFLLGRLETFGSFALYAGFNLVAFVMIFFWVPETMQRTLEELDWVFAVPVGTFAKYQLTQALPWWFKRYVFFQRSATLKPLYHFEKIAMTARKDSIAHQNMVQSSDDEISR
ncbi:sugar porter (SP) family MFS transporter [Pochonia chlamydosporia 170]|uniref:Sugar porter (SP) family MFS transporter n=1 Tax=Pochonia chlamydosporia 170 TaxID=1380566 RepID=A0A179FS11_METCM|nr:sugar porter (SP) family MFS transporter [Pochonia chlamydosporia 170]OAQ67873.1 sugar porter (SP) family MFS transporter [Pochonia chlamydosporia 170]